MTKKSFKTKPVLLVAVSLSLLACETVQTTTKPLDASPPAAEVTLAPPAPREPVIVRSDIVPDDPAPVPVAKPKPARRVMASAIVPDEATAPDPVASVETAPAKPEVAPPPLSATPDPALATIAKPEPGPAAATLTPETPATSAPPTTITPPPGTPETPTATPSSEPPPSSILNNPSEWLKDPGAVLQASIGGVPLWLVVLLAVLTIISLLVGFGRSKDKPEKEEPVAA